MPDRNNTQLVCDALMMDYWRHGKVKEVIVQSNQGSKYASNEYPRLLKAHNMLCSFSRKSECYDNAGRKKVLGETPFLSAPCTLPVAPVRSTRTKVDTAIKQRITLRTGVS
jgi:transposase InsO family protein